MDNSKYKMSQHNRKKIKTNSNLDSSASILNHGGNGLGITDSEIRALDNRSVRGIQKGMAMLIVVVLSIYLTLCLVDLMVYIAFQT